MKTLKTIFLLISLPFCALAAKDVSENNSITGQVVWWGKNDFWKTHYSDHTNGLVENGNEFLSNAVEVAAMTGIGLALKSDSMVYAFGLSSWPGVTDVPVGLSNVVSITAEGGSFWAIKRDGTVANWGSLENGDQNHANIVTGLSNITSIVWGGYKNYMALKTNGTLLGFRFDAPDTDKYAELIRPVKVRGQVLSNVVALASMGYTPLVLKNSGMVFSLGYQTPGVPPVEPRYEVHDNAFYEYLGGESAQLPYQYTSADPIMIGGQILSNVVALASGGQYALALKKNGTVVAWGNNTYGATKVPLGLSNVIAIAAGGNHGLALKRDGTVTAWGANEFGQISVPDSLSNVVAIAAAGEFSLAVITSSPPSSIFIQPHGQLEETIADSDLVFKGKMISTRAETNASFPDWGKAHTTKFVVISVLKGSVQTNTISFLHITGQPMAWSGSEPPPNYQFEVGQSYIVFAMKADKPDWLYSPSSNSVVRPNEFRQLMHGDIGIHTFDARQLNVVSAKAAVLFEQHLSTKSNAGNQFPNK